MLHLNINHKISFLLGILVGFFVLRHQVFTEPCRWSMSQILGFELDFFEKCIVMRDKYGVIEDCRSFINCEMCENVEAIHIITAEDMTQGDGFGYQKSRVSALVLGSQLLDSIQSLI